MTEASKNDVSTRSIIAEDSAAAGLARPASAFPGRPVSYRWVYLLAAAGAFLFSTKGIAIKLAYAEKVDVETLLALRMAFALPAYLVVGAVAIRERTAKGATLPSPAGFLRAGLIGVLGYWVASYTDFLGLLYISAQFERLILFTYPIFVVIFGKLFFGQRLATRTVGGALVSYAGLALIFTQKQVEAGAAVTLGTLWVLASAIAYALYQLLAKNEIGRIGPRLFTCVAMIGAALAAFAQFLFTHGIAMPVASERVLLLALYLAIGATVLPTFLMNAALHHISAQVNAAIGNLSPIATIVLAVIILGERLTPVDVAGAALVLGGIAWFTMGRASRRGSSGKSWREDRI